VEDAASAWVASAAYDLQNRSHERELHSARLDRIPVEGCCMLHELSRHLTLPAAPTQDIFRAVNVDTGMVVAERVIIASGAAKRRGLLGRQALDPDEGMYLVPCQWIHMFGMKFPIDVAFLARDGRILAIHTALRPNRLSRLVLWADGVLELASGALQRSRTTVGCRIDFVEV